MFWAFIGVIAFLWIMGASSSSGNTSNNRLPDSTRHRSTATLPPATINTRAPEPRKKMKFTELSPSGTSAASTTSRGPATSDLSGLRDALTGEPLRKALGLHQCKCTVYYHTNSYSVLKEQNSGRCAACGSTSIKTVVDFEAKTASRKFTPDVVTLRNYKSKVGSVVTFEGTVQAVKESKRGNDFAVMFERKSWTKGFKLVFFRGVLNKLGGRNYVMGLNGRRLRVRGLIVNHQRFGYEIVVSDKAMILDVS